MRRSKADKYAYLRNICRQVDRAHKQRVHRAVFEGVRKITGKQAPRLIKDKNGKLLAADQNKVKDRWMEYFHELYNPCTPTDQSVLSEIAPCQNRDTPTPHLLKAEVEAAVARMKNNKSPGADNITAEEMQVAGQYGVDVLFELRCKIWETEKVPDC